MLGKKETPTTKAIGVSGIDQNLRSWFRKYLMKRVAILSKSLQTKKYPRT